jgi:hypothetical protein
VVNAACAVSTFSAPAVSCIGAIQNYCNEIAAGTVAGGCKYSFGWTGQWSDSQSIYYPTVSGSRSFSSAQVRANEYCCNNWGSCTNCAVSGGGGLGVAQYSCECMYAGTGRHGSIQIRY